MKLQILAAIAALTIAGAASAQPTPSPEMMAAREAVMKSCAADMQKLCADKQGREAMMCIARDNRDKASDDCKAALDKMRAARQAAGGPGGGQH